MIDDQNTSANATVPYSDIINIVSDAQYMDVQTKRLFIESLKAKFANASKDMEEEQGGSEIEENIAAGYTVTKVEGSQIPMSEGLWESDGSSFHASGAWQTKPLLMRGAFVEDIDSLGSDDAYPFPSWREIIALACDGGKEDEDQTFDNEFLSELDFPHDPNDENRFEGSDNSDEEFGNQCDDDEEDFEDEDDIFYVWGDGDDYEDEENSDNPPSRLVQHSWPRQDESNYYHANVNTDWLDTFEIKQFGPFNDPDSLEALLRTKDEDNPEIDVARTLLVNDVDRWFPKLSDWMDRRFNCGVLPARWRRDDAQISLSYPNGGIGPHVDDYDVFLIQLEGERTWDVLWEENPCGEEDTWLSKISVRDETDSMLPESSMNGVRILNITKLQSLQKSRCGKVGTRLTRLHLRPGDCLYLPPRVLHCGTAVEASANCMTLSVGCRAPSAMELLDGLSDLMKKSASTGTPNTMAAASSIFPSTSAALQAFHQRYTNTQASSGEYKRTSDSHFSDEDKSILEIHSAPSQSSWLSPHVKNEMKSLVMKAVESALDDDLNILDPLVGRFVTKSNRVEDEEFGLDGDLPSFSYPKALGSTVPGERQDEGEDDGTGIWADATDVLLAVFDAPKSENESYILRRAEGISFAWSSVYDNERQNRIFRLYAQGRPPFEVVGSPGAAEEAIDDPNKSSVLTQNSVIGRLMDRIANGAPLDRAFVVDELKIPLDLKPKGTNHSISRLLHNLVEEGLLYGGHEML